MKIDLHVHTKEMSACGVLSAEEVVKGYAQAGFDGIVLTNHYNSWTQWWVYETYKIGGEDYFTAYKKHWEETARLGERYGLRVFFGCELKTDRSNNDYLVYGVPDSFLSRNNDDLWKMSAGDIGRLAKEENFLLYQAHPFRNHMQVTPPHELFGIEVKNANPRHDSRNDIAEIWATKFGLHGISGSDCHQKEDIARGGIETDEDVKTTEDLVRVLREGIYRIL